MNYDKNAADNQMVNEPDLTGTYTAAEYITWKTDELMELIRGKIFKLSSPIYRHQEVIGNLYFLMRKIVGLGCKVCLSPLDVYLIHPGEDWKYTKNIFEPDIFVVCDLSKLQRRGCIGAPDLVVEVLSPSTAAKDLGAKREIYQEYGVKELWIVDPKAETVAVHVLVEGAYKTLPLLRKGEKLESQTLSGMVLEMDGVFEK